MKQLAVEAWNFIKRDFNLVTYGLTVCFVAIGISMNYWLNLENGIIDSLPTSGPRFLGYLALYVAAYYPIALLHLRKGQPVPHRFWVASLLGIVIYAADTGFVFHEILADWLNPKPRLYGFVYKILSNGIEFITIAIPLFWIGSKYFDKAEWLGLKAKESIKPFLILLCLIAPFIFLSAFEAGLNNYYPTYRFSSVHKALGTEAWVPAAIYEFFYGADFFNVELMFRGFMVVGLSTLIGPKAVLPMACFYCAIHFGKPPLETISSFFGGYILGGVACQTRSIWGGILAHIGLAWMMELSAFIVKAYWVD